MLKTLLLITEIKLHLKMKTVVSFEHICVKPSFCNTFYTQAKI